MSTRVSNDFRTDSSVSCEILDDLSALIVVISTVLDLKSMGKKGKPKKMGSKGGILGGITSAASNLFGGGATPGAPGQTGSFRVDRFGNITKIPGKKRRKAGYRMPQLVKEQIRASNEFMRTVGTALLLKAT